MRRVRAWWRRDRLPLLLFVLTLVIMSFPLILRLHDHLPMNNVDTYQVLWQNWWVIEALSNGYDPNWTPLLFHPNGLDITVMHPRWTTLPVLAPLYLLFGDPFAHNVAALLGLLFKAYGMYLFGLLLFQRRIPAWVCGAFYAFSAPSLNMAFGDPMTGATEWIPWFMLVFLRALSRLRAYQFDRTLWALMALAGLFFAFNAYINIKIGVFAMLLGGSFLLLYTFAHELWRMRMFWAAVAVFALSATLFAAPLLITLLGSGELTGAVSFAVESDNKASIDLLSFVKADHYRPLNYMQSIASLSGDHVQMTVVAWGLSHVGVVSIVFALVGARYAFKVERSAILWVILALFFWLLTLGVVIHLRRQPLDLPFTLYGLLQSVPLLHIIRWPFRVVFVFLFPFAILIGYGLHYRLPFTRLDAKNRTLLTLSVIALLYGSSLFPIPIRPVEKPPHLVALDALQDGAIIDLPLGRQSSRYFMSLQRDHRRPIIEGFISRNPIHAYEYIESNALLAATRVLSPPSPLPELADWQAEFDQLAADGFRYIALHREVPVRLDHIPVLSDWIWDMFAPAVPAYEDSNVRIYDITALYAPESPIYGENEFAAVDAPARDRIAVGDTFMLHSWQLMGPHTVAACQSLAIESWWKLARRVPVPHTLSLILANTDGASQITKADNNAPAGRFTLDWKPDRFYRDRTAFQVPCELKPGQYPILMAMRESATGEHMDFRYDGGAPIGSLYYLTSLHVEES